MRLRLLAIGLGILLPVAGSFAQTVSFGAATNFAAGSVPTAVAVGDFNGDGKSDLAVPNFTTNTVSILVGNGAGSFGAPTSFAVGSNPRSVAVGDFNGDGKSDLATANENSFNVSILLGNGNGTFGSAANFAVGTGAFNPPEQFGHSPSSVAIGDFNNDGKSDLAVANRISNNVSILLGTGTGSFGAATNFTMGTGPSCVAISDLNGDGKSDLAVANQGSNTVSIRLGNGNGSFGAATNFIVGTNPSFVAVGDLNGDSKPDLAVATNDNAILLGNGDGTFSAATDFGSFSYAIADFSGNGKPDAVTNISSNNVTVALDIGTGAFSAATSFSVAIGDFNSDGKLDLAVVNENSNTVSILLNTTVPPLVLTCAANKTVDCGSAWSFDPPTVTTNACSNINVTLTFSDVTSGGPCPAIITRTWRAADACSNSITCTQRVTVADTPLPSVPSCERTLSDGILNTNDWSANVFQNNAGGSSSASPVATGGCGTIGGPYLRITNTVQTGTAAAEAAVFGIYLNNGAIHNPATQGAIRVIDYSECAILFAGAGGVGAGQAAGPALLQGNKFYVVSAMKQITLTNTFLDWNSIAISGLQATDFDLLATGPLGNQIGVRDTSQHPNFCGGGPIQFGFFRANSDSGIGYTTVGGIDSWQVQLDTFLPVTSTLAQTASFGPATDFAAGSYAIFVAVGDFNGDGKPDLAVANYLSNNVSILLGTGTGSFGSAANFGVGSSPRSVAVEDLNGDGKLDLATANENSFNVSILLGTGTGAFGSAANFAVGTGAFNPPEQFAHSPSSVAIGDLNGDGKPDLAVANRISNNVSILLGTGTGAFGATNNFIVGTGAYSVAIGDLNSDLKPDLAVANPDSNNISILLGTGTGAFSAATNFSGGSIPGSVAIGEFNADGKPDLAVANIGSNNVSVLMGNGAGTFSAATNVGVGSNPNSVAIGDFNGDGESDLAVANRSSNNVSVLMGNGAGAFSAATNVGVGSNPNSVAIGDFNGDGKSDLAVAKGNSNNVSILLNITVPPLVLTCAADKTVECGSAWSFDPPTVTTDCSAANVTLTFSDVTNGGPCPAVITRTWQATDTCGNSVTCNQMVTVADTPLPSVPSCERTFADGTLNTTDWSANGFQNNAGGSGSASQVATGGCGPIGGPYLRITNAVQAGTAAAPAAVFGIYLYNNAIHNPATAGAIRSIDYSECAILFASAGGGDISQAAGPALLQGNKFYVVSATRQITLTNTFLDWNSIAISGLQAADFDMLASGPLGNQIGVRDTSRHPNFCGGGPIQFGFFRANLTTGTGYTTVGGIDSWGVQLVCYNNAVSIDDNNVCTIDGCDPVTGPYHTPIIVDDGNACTTDGCDPVTGPYHTPIIIDDGNACTTDSCNSVTGPYHTPIIVDDNNPCTAKTVSFGPATNFAAGSVPTAVAVGDFDGDGTSDLAVANFVSNNVSFLRGTGDGSFGSATNFPVGNGPRSIAVADVNGDGILDIATANENSNTVSVLIGAGAGTFGSATNIAVGNNPRSVAIGDVNNDGMPDLAVANQINNNVSILLNGAAGFGAATNFTVGTGPNSVALRDLNGDGKLDLAVANQGSNTVSILINTTGTPTGSVSFRTATNFLVGTSPSFVEVGDINGDLKPDLAVANQDNSGAILLGDGNGAFSAATNFGIGALSIAIANFGGRGQLDIAMTTDGATVSVIMGIGAGTFSAATYFNVAIGDFNRDGKLDIVMANSNSNNVSVLLNTTAPPLVLTCAANKTVECGSAWSFDPPTVTTTCSNTNVTLTFSDATSGGPCPAVISRTWQATDACGNSVTCTQRVTVTDTPPSVPSCDRTLSDNTFNTNNWSANVFQNNAGGSSSAGQVATGGCAGTVGGPYLRTTNAVQAGTAAAPAAVFGIYLNNGAIHDPATQGAIRLIDYSECAILFAGAGGAATGQAAGPALLQDNKFYVVSAMKQGITLPTTFVDWNDITINGLQAADFDMLASGPVGNQIGVRDTSQHPNFCNGGPIQFGFFRANSAPGTGYTSVGGIDSWGVRLNCYNICGQKFNDLDGDGVKDAGEPNLIGWTIALSGPVDATTRTDAKGYCFRGLPCGMYIVSEVAMRGWNQTVPPAPGTYSVTIGPGMTPGIYDFGNQQEAGCINDRSNKGVDFWLTFPANYAPDPANPPQLSLDLAGPPGVSGQVTIPGLAFVTNWTIPAGGVATVTLPPEADLGALNDAVTIKGIHVTATGEIAVYALNHVLFSSDAYLGLPSDVLGAEYIVLGYPNVHTDVPELNGTQFAIVATADNTEVTITPTVATGIRTAGVPFTVAMNRGDTYQLRNTNNAPSDLSGTIITADKPIGVFGSHPCANIPGANQFFCDTVVEQLLPTTAWGTSFVAMPLATRFNGAMYRVVAAQANTTVTLNGVVVTLNRGKVHEQPLPGPAHIIADKPVLVAQYANSSDYDFVTNSDPFMVLIPSTNLFREEYTVSSMTSGFTTNFINVVAPNSLTNLIVLDGTPVAPTNFSPIPAGGPPSGFSGAQLAVTPGKHTLTQSSGSPQPFGVTVYGFAEYDSYGYPGGMRFGDVQPPVITCSNSVTLTVDATSCLATVPAIQATVNDNCTDNALSTTQTPPAGTMLGPGTVDLVFRSTDLAGNHGTCTTRLMVVDPNPPTIQCPGNIVVRASRLDGEVVSFTATASTPCRPNLNVVSTPASGTRFPLGTTTVTCTSGGGNVPLVQCSFTVTVLARPADFDLIRPADLSLVTFVFSGANSVNASGIFTWASSSSIAGAVHYFIRFWRDDRRTQLALESGPLAPTHFGLRPGQLANGAYWWDVEAVDVAGNGQVSHDLRAVTVENTNAAIGYITGRLFQPVTGAPLTSGSVTIQKVGTGVLLLPEQLVADTGHYLAIVAGGEYRINAFVDGHRHAAATVIVVPVQPPATVTVDFPMTAIRTDMAGAIDIDDNGKADALTDGLVLGRHIAGISGAALIAGVLADNCRRCTAGDIETELDQIYDRWGNYVYDVDGDGMMEMNDATIILRYLFGFRGAVLVAGACPGCHAAAIESTLNSMMP